MEMTSKPKDVKDAKVGEGTGSPRKPRLEGVTQTATAERSTDKGASSSHDQPRGMDKLEKLVQTSEVGKQVRRSDDIPHFSSILEDSPMGQKISADIQNVIKFLRQWAGYGEGSLKESFTYQKSYESRGKTITEGTKIAGKLEQALRDYKLEDVRGREVFDMNFDKIAELHRYLGEQPKKTVTQKDGNAFLEQHAKLEQEEQQIRKDSAKRGRVTEIREERQKINEQFYDRKKFADPSTGYNPQEGLNKLCKADTSGTLKYLFDSPLSLRGGEQLTLGQHTEVVAMRFETFVAPTWNENFGSVMPLEHARLLVLLQDVGKPIFKQSELQDLANIPLTAEIASKFILKAEEAQLLLDMSKINLGDVQKQVEGNKGDLSKKQGVVEQDTANYINKLAQNNKVDRKLLAQALEEIYKCDVGSYASMSRFTPIKMDGQGNFSLGFDRQRQQGSNALHEALDKLEV